VSCVVRRASCVVRRASCGDYAVLNALLESSEETSRSDGYECGKCDDWLCFGRVNAFSCWREQNLTHGGVVTSDGNRKP
jgi:hypothetical protein